LLQKLRTGVFDCLVGVNLLREGLDLPEVALVAIMDSDIECFLRDKRSLIQTIGRAARNTQSRVLLYSDTVSKSMQEAIDETTHRREIQLAYNKKHNIIPQTVSREVGKIISTRITPTTKESLYKKSSKKLSKKNTLKQIIALEASMRESAEKLDFETAIKLRQEWQELRKSLGSYWEIADF
jgi:excinuclease ABC subunit B